MRSPIINRPLFSCITVLLLGYATGLQVGRIAPYADRLNQTYGFSLSTIGWLTSLVTVFVAVLAIPTSRMIPVFGVVKMIRVGAVTMAAGAGLFAFAETAPLMMSARIVEAAGHLITVIAAPSYLALNAPETLRRIFLALWSSFLPVGFALSSILDSLLLEDIPLRSLWLVYAGVMATVAAAVLIFLPASNEKITRSANRYDGSQIAWVLVAAFGIYAFLSISFFTFLPSFPRHSTTQYLSIGAVPLFVPLGSFTAAFLFARSAPNLPVKILPIGFLGIFTAGFFVFQKSSVDFSLLQGLYAFACGITAASIFTSVPVVTRGETATAVTIGAIGQAGGAMVLFGAPLAGYVLEAGGWGILGYTLSAASLAMAACAFASLNRGANS